MNKQINEAVKLTREEIVTIASQLSDGAENAKAQVADMAPRAGEDRTTFAVLGYAIQSFTSKAALIDKLMPNRDGTPCFAIQPSPEALEHLQALINEHHKPELSELDGHVSNVWYDGEVTSQKSGDLLWQRSQHISMPALTVEAIPGIIWPSHTHSNKGYIFTDGPGIMAVRTAMMDIVVDAILKSGSLL